MKNLPKPPSYCRLATILPEKHRLFFHFNLSRGNRLRSNQPVCSMRFQIAGHQLSTTLVGSNPQFMARQKKLSFLFLPSAPGCMLLPICLRSSIFSRLFFLKTFMKHKPYQNTRYPESSRKGSSRRRNSVLLAGFSAQREWSRSGKIKPGASRQERLGLLPLLSAENPL